VNPMWDATVTIHAPDGSAVTSVTCGVVADAVAPTGPSWRRRERTESSCGLRGDRHASTRRCRRISRER
jgi:hypothetical protein